MAGHILFTDNDPDFLSTRAEFLEQAGYEVLRAPTLPEAEWLLRNANVHLVIVDVRMQDDDDERDESGLVLAKQETFRSVPKIILTNYPNYQHVREVMGPTREGLPPAVEFLAKEEGPDTLIAAVKRTFTGHVRINWNLTIDWKARDRFALVNLIEPGLERERLLNRAEELEDLFRRLFYEKNHIRIDRLLWQREGRVALTVFAFKEGAATDAFVIVCGQNAKVSDEVRRYEEFVSKAAGQIGIELKLKAETTHFAANAYHLAKADLENVRSLAELYRADPDRLFHTALSTLLERTLAAWDSTQPVLANKTPDTLYREQLGLAEADALKAALEERVQTLLRQIPTLGANASIKRESGMLIIRLKDQVYRHPDPVSVLDQTLDFGQPPMVVPTPGTFAGDSILVDKKEQTIPATDSAVPEKQQKTIRIVRTWLTDFAEAGQAPPPWNYVALEAAIRFDWVEENDLQQLYVMETRLVDLRRFHKLDTQDVEPPVRRALRAIDTIRALAFKKFGKDAPPYHLGIFFQAVSRIANFNPAFPLTTNELARLAHALIAAAMIAGIIQSKPNDTASAVLDETSIRIDKENQTAWVGKKRMPLRGQNYDLLCYLHDNANRVCKREDIVRNVFGQAYGKSEENRLNTAIQRLRDKVEDDPRHPRYLLTVPDVGYRLVLKPEE